MNSFRHSGFTLIEMLIVVAVISILAGIAYPSYTGYLQDSRRNECKTVLLSYAAALERQFVVANSYPDDGIDRFTCPAAGGRTTYNLSYEGDAESFTLTATPTGPQTNDKCGKLELKHSGARSADGSGNKCW